MYYSRRLNCHTQWLCFFSTEYSQKGTDEEITIVSTSVAICEILDEFGFDNVIGVPETSGTLPKRYKDTKTVGSPMNPDLETIRSLNPDLVLSPQTLEVGTRRFF